jgi:hypothetical protein
LYCLSSLSIVALLSIGVGNPPNHTTGTSWDDLPSGTSMGMGDGRQGSQKVSERMLLFVGKCGENVVKREKSTWNQSKLNPLHHRPHSALQPFL